MMEIGIFDHKWLDSECVGNGCKSLLLLQRAERAEELADKYKWQVRDTCVRAEKAERALDAADARVEAMREAVENARPFLHAFEPIDDRLINEDHLDLWRWKQRSERLTVGNFRLLAHAIEKLQRALPTKGSPT